MVHGYDAGTIVSPKFRGMQPLYPFNVKHLLKRTDMEVVRNVLLYEESRGTVHLYSGEIYSEIYCTWSVITSPLIIMVGMISPLGFRYINLGSCST